jgi:type I restriction enzyme M protein
MSHAVHHLAPTGRAGIVMPRGTLTSAQSGDDTIRKAMLDDDVIECIIDLPGQLFFNVTIPSCLWFFNKDKSKWKNDRTGQVLFIDARKLGSPVSRTQIEFGEDEIVKISEVFSSWANGNYEDIDGFCRSVPRSEIRDNSDALSPGRYIGTEENESEDFEHFDEKMTELTHEFRQNTRRSRELEARIASTLKAIGYEL